MVTKFLDHERTPPTAPYYYNNPITALGFQSDRWFQICSESVAGFWEVIQDKTTTRINVGPCGSVWSTNPNTYMVLDVFGPDGLGYIPETPDQVNCTWNGTGADVVNAINSGAFMLQHRDHGEETGWSEPDFKNSDINSLNNTDLTFVWSINCLTGKFDWTGGECFAEKFHRHTSGGQNSGALGIIAASDVSYSFVNDTYVWGAYDNMWPDFLPDIYAPQVDPEPRGVLPGFGNAAGKYFLEQSSWPYNPSSKEVTYYLFHHHGDAFMTVYSEIPQDLTVMHNPILYAGVTSFDVTANEDSFIALTVNGEIIGTAEGTGVPVTITIPGQVPPDQMLVTITLQNYYRYEALINVIPPVGPYVVRKSYTINDITGGNGDGLMDYGETNLLSLTVENVGVEQADDVTVVLNTTDQYVTITDNTEFYGNIAAGATAVVADGFEYDVANDIPDGHNVSFEVIATDVNDSIWVSYFAIPGHAPVLEFVDDVTISDPTGNNNGKIDPGETVDLIIEIENTGSSEAFNILGELSVIDPYLTIDTDEFDYGDLAGGEIAEGTFTATADINTPAGHHADLLFNMTADLGIEGSGEFEVVIGQIPVLILDLDENSNSSPAMEAALNEMEVAYEYLSSFPPDLNLYSTIFVCLGIYPSNHVLSSAEGQDLAGYLNNGGNLYMEGGDTWYYDSQTAVHSMFNINGTSDGSSDMSTVVGQTGTFTEGMSFNYSGDNSWMDHIEPISPAVMIFENQSPPYGTGVAYDEESYRTIGTSHEFGGLDDATSPSTKEELMSEYLEFLGISQTLQASFASNTTYTCTEETINFYDQSTGGAISWEWTFEGGSPGTSSNQNPLVVYFNPGTFDVTLTISDGVEFSTILMEDYMTVVAIPPAPATPTGDDEVCTNFTLTSEYETTGAMYADSYMWEILPADAGTISGDGTIGTVEWTTNWEGIATIKVKGMNDACGEGGFSAAFEVVCSICTGVEEISDNTRIQVFPNPNNGSFTIKLNLNTNEVVDLRIFSALNEIVFEEKNVITENDYTKIINLSKYANGIYYLQITGENTSWVKKIIIQN
jgi:PKD repeat protein